MLATIIHQSNIYLCICTCTTSRDIIILYNITKTLSTLLVYIYIHKFNNIIITSYYIITNLTSLYIHSVYTCAALHYLHNNNIIIILRLVFFFFHTIKTFAQTHINK